jgi:hypothetical protein
VPLIYGDAPVPLIYGDAPVPLIYGDAPVPLIYPSLYRLGTVSRLYGGASVSIASRLIETR